MSATSSAVATATATAAAATGARATGGQGPALIAISAGLLGVNAFFIALRCWTKATVSKNFSINDLGMVTVLGFFVGLFVLLLLGVRGGIGHHTLTSNLANLSEALKWTFFLEILYVLLTSIMKASLAITLLQWAKSKVQIYLLRTAIALDAFICIVVVEYFIVQCTPISYSWEFLNPLKKGTCLPMDQQIVVGEILSVVTISIDMLFLFVPFFMMKGRGINKRLKMYIFAIIGSGVAASIANFIRLGSLVKLKASTDPLFDAAPVFLWSAVEVSIGIQVAGILELSPLMRKYRVKGFEQAFDEIEEDRVPIRLQSMDKNTISFPMEREIGGREMNGMGMGGSRQMGRQMGSEMGGRGDAGISRPRMM